MRPQHIIILFILSLFLYNSANSTSTQAEPDDQDIATVFKEHNAQGTMVLISLDNKLKYIHNHKRANTRLTPASTFKIFNSIIALEEAVIQDQHDIIKWDGTKRFLATWNKDHNMKTAFQSSCVWFYQELAKKIGIDIYQKYFERFNYGNKLVGDNVTNFWLAGGGDLKISPMEQVNFLKDLYQQKFDISKRTYEILQDIMLVDSTDNYKLYAKTGAATQDWVGHGWYIGYLTTKDSTWFFATNILIDGIKDLAKRKSITIEVLKQKEILK